MKTYSLAQFNADFPDDDACLDYLFEVRFGKLTCCPHCGVVAAQFVRVEGRKCYACVHCRHQLYPMAGTIFHRSTTSLKTWFTAIYLFSVSKNGVAALELQRQLGVTLKTAWRIGMKIRTAMKQDGIMLTGIVEADEAYFGGRRRSSNRFANKVPVLGAVERGGKARVVVTDTASVRRVTDFIGSTVLFGSELQTDESALYGWAHNVYKHRAVRHGKYEFVRGENYSNTIEGIWGRIKPSLLGSHRAVSKKYLQNYLDEHVWRYNHRQMPDLYPLLLDVAAQPV